MLTLKERIENAQINETIDLRDLGLWVDNVCFSHDTSGYRWDTFDTCNPLFPKKGQWASSFRTLAEAKRNFLKCYATS